MSDNFTGFESEEPKLPSIGGLEGIADPATKKALTAIKEVLEIRLGTRPRTSALDKAVTFRDLFKYNFASIRVNGIDVINQNPDTAVRPIGNGGTPNSGTPTVDVPNDTVIPGAPLGLIATGTKLAVLLEWDAPGTTIAFAEVHRSDVDNIGNAVLIGSTQSTLYGDIIGETGITRYYWIRFVNTAGIAGPFNSVNGTEATTGQLGSNDLISVDGAKIIDATILDAKIGSVSANKIRSGIVQVDQTIQIGQGANRVFIHGSGIIRSAGALDFANGTGFWQGVTGGVPKWFVGSPSKYFAWDGNNPYIQSDNLTLTDSQLIFNGSGTFNGDGNFTGTLNVNNNFIVDPLGNATLNSATVKGRIEADSGYFGGELLAGVLDFTKLSGERQIFLSSGTYIITVPAEKINMRLSICGASGGGGGGSSGSGYPVPGGGGGGSTGGILATFVGLTPGATYTLVVGSRGLGGTTGVGVNGTDGTDGGDTYISGLLIATGGKGGKAGNIHAAIGAGGGAGGASGTSGNNGQNGQGTVVGTNQFGGNTPPTDGAIGLGGVAGTNGRKGGNGGGATVRGGPSAENGLDGMATVEFFNPNSVVIRTEWNVLISALQSQGIATS